MRKNGTCKNGDILGWKRKLRGHVDGRRKGGRKDVV